MRAEGRWITVWPCEPAAEILAATTRFRRRKRSAADAKTRPNSKWSPESSAALIEAARRMRRLKAGEYA